MKLATWNVNSVRARLPRVLDWLGSRAPDVVCLQEIKCLDGQFPREPIEELGYNVATHGQKTYNGVAILSRRPFDEVTCGLPDGAFGDEARVIAATIGDLEVVDLYVVNGKEPGSDKFRHKLEWWDRVCAWIEDAYTPHSGAMPRKVVITGDFNITFDDRDVYDPEEWRGKIHCTDEERAALRRLVDLGFADAFRAFHEEGGHYTWWDFRTRAFRGDRGLRIDHFLMSPAALETCSSVEIDKEERAQDKPSDHAPVIAELSG
ncbi:MAG: exodeoxyribonuclease III [Planctomycetota bacterium]